MREEFELLTVCLIGVIYAWLGLFWEGWMDFVLFGFGRGFDNELAVIFRSCVINGQFFFFFLEEVVLFCLVYVLAN